MEHPTVKLDHLRALTDDAGVLQHARYTTSVRREGYTLDDNSRALIVCVKHFWLYRRPEIEELADKYMS